MSVVNAGGELTEYRWKVADLEVLLAGKEKELLEHADAMKQKEATVQHFSEAQAKADEHAQRLAKKLQELEAAAAPLPLSDVIHEDVAARF